MSDLGEAWRAWLDAPVRDGASTDRLAAAFATEHQRLLVEMGHAILTIKPGGVGWRPGGDPRRRGYRARCSCRWTSAYYPSPDAARFVGREHVSRADAGRG